LTHGAAASDVIDSSPDVRPQQVAGIDVGQGRHFSYVGDNFPEESKSERKKKMARVQMKMVGAIFIVAAMLTTTAVIPRADAQSTSTGQTKRDKQKIIVDDEPESVSKQTNRTKADCEKGHMKWDDTAKKCSK
jgi:hypothetical protein